MLIFAICASEIIQHDGVTFPSDLTLVTFVSLIYIYSLSNCKGHLFNPEKKITFIFMESIGIGLNFGIGASIINNNKDIYM